MNRKVTSSTLVVILAVMAVACSGVPPSRVAFNSIQDATVGVQTAVQSFNALYQQGKFTDADREKVKAAYEKFQRVALLANSISSAATDPNAPVTALTVINAAADDFFNAVRIFVGGQ